MNRSAGLRPGTLVIGKRAGSETGAPQRFMAPMRVQSWRSRLSMNRARNVQRSTFNAQRSTLKVERWKLNVADAFSFADLLVVVAVLSVLAAVAMPIFVKTRSGAHLAQCLANVTQINRAVQMYADEHQHRLPQMSNCPAPGAWWFYKEQVKGYLGLTGVSSSDDKVFAC